MVLSPVLLRQTLSLNASKTALGWTERRSRVAAGAWAGHNRLYWLFVFWERGEKRHGVVRRSWRVGRRRRHRPHSPSKLGRPLPADALILKCSAKGCHMRYGIGPASKGLVQTWYSLRWKERFYAAKYPSIPRIPYRAFLYLLPLPPRIDR